VPLIEIKHSVCRLVGALRLTEANDGIGIPLYNHPGSNQIFVGETDFDLRITRFVPYPDGDAFRIDYGVLDVVSDKRFEIGDYSLIPFWLNDRVGALPGGLSVSEFDEIFGKNPGGIGEELRTIIAHSRTGYFQRLRSEDQLSFVQQEHPDIWDEEPVHSRYWVSRFRSAILTASKLEGDAAIELRQLLKERAEEWIYKFQYNGNFRLLLELLRVASDGLLEQQKLQLSLFESLIDRIERGEINALKRAEVKSAVMRFFPRGLFYFHVWENEAIQKKYHLRRNRQLRRPVFEPRVRIDFHRMLQKYLHDDVWHHLDTLLTLTSAIYGSSDLPTPIMHALHTLYSEKVTNVRYELSKAFNEGFRDIGTVEMWPGKAKALLSEVESLNRMLRILEGPSRLTGIIPSKLKAFDDDLIEELRRYVVE